MRIDQRKKNLRVLHKSRIDKMLDPLEGEDKEPEMSPGCLELVNMGLRTP